MVKIWLEIWLGVKENGTKKNQIGENGGERKKILVQTLYWHGCHICQVTKLILINFHFLVPKSFPMKSGYKWPSGF